MQHNAIVIDPNDNVATALSDLAERGMVRTNTGISLSTRGAIPSGHKLALVDLAQGDVIRKYGHPIGVAAELIAAGTHVHTHNLTGPED